MNKTDYDKVAVHSPKNLFMYGLGKLDKGYTILSKEVAEKWLEASSVVRIAEPEEVARHYGK
jgi:hypothetical protein